MGAPVAANAASIVPATPLHDGQRDPKGKAGRRTTIRRSAGRFVIRPIWQLPTYAIKLAAQKYSSQDLNHRGNVDEPARRGTEPDIAICHIDTHACISGRRDRIDDRSRPCVPQSMIPDYPRVVIPRSAATVQWLQACAGPSRTCVSIPDGPGTSLRPMRPASRG